ncbi:MAG: MBL fold metallo-hydrolase [Planctomycetota bacterium]
MIYHQIRNATCVLEWNGRRVLVDPMLGESGTLPPYAILRSKARRNPLTPLPENVETTLRDIDACLISHVHFGVDCDHLDSPGAAWLREHQPAIYARAGDERALRKRDLQGTSVPPGESRPFLAEPNADTTANATITAVPAAHGRGLVGKIMGPGVGYILNAPDEPAVYLTGDTVYTSAVDQALDTHRPKVIIAPGGGARLDLGGPVLLSIDELARLLDRAAALQAVVLINHLEALNHCPTTHDDLATRFRDALQAGRLYLPRDGQAVEVTSM